MLNLDATTWMVPNSVPLAFRPTLLACNRRNFNKRIAVVFLPADDHTFTSASVYHNIYQIAQTRQVAIRIIAESRQIPDSFQKIKDDGRGKIDLVLFGGHGSEKEIDFGKSRLTVEQVKNPQFWNGVSSHATIILTSCRTAVELGIAIAESLPKSKVYAPVEDALFDTTTVVKCERHGMECLSLNLDGENHMKRIQSVSAKCIRIDHPCHQAAPLANRVEFLNLVSIGENISAMLTLSALYSYGIGGVPRDLARSKRYLISAANSGHIGSNYRIGKILKEGADPSRAFLYFFRAAQQGCQLSCFEVGLHYELRGSYETARYWYSQSQGSEPTYRIGRTFLSEEKWGEAVATFIQAALLGSLKAVDRLLELADQGRAPDIVVALDNAASM